MIKDNRGWKSAGETAGDKAVPNKRGEEGKQGNIQEIIYDEAARFIGSI
jgi:hypothetical protein